MLPSVNVFEQLLAEHFILYKPRDIVSGDFYWAKEINNFIIVAAADCTGHGVPGAFVSMLGISFLNEIMQDNNIFAQENIAANILNELREKVKIALKQSGKINEAKDGMDIALCVIEKQTNKLQFAGAHNPLFVIRHKDHEKIQVENVKIQKEKDTILYHIKSDAMPIGIFIKEKPFTNQEIQLYPDDIIYIFSDGFVDQIG